jgi:hypothetical protein
VDARVKPGHDEAGCVGHVSEQVSAMSPERPSGMSPNGSPETLNGAQAWRWRLWKPAGAATASPQSPGSIPYMRTDLVIAGIVGSFSLLLGLMGFFILDWSPVLSGLLIAVAVLADGYFLYGIVQTAKERQAGKTQ